MNEDLIFDRLRFARQAAAIERCHMKPHLMRYSVGHHSHDVVTLLILTWAQGHNGELPSRNLLIAGHKHDWPEIVIGDIASPVKEMLGNARLVAVERNADRWMGVDVDLTEEEELYLHAADRFEAYLWCVEEVARGNSDLQDWIDYYTAKWEAAPETLPQSFRVILANVENYGMRHLNRNELNIAGGLA